METLDFTNITRENGSSSSNSSSSGSSYGNVGQRSDGERTPNRGPCSCGYKHWYEGKEYDFVFKWPTSSSGEQFIGVNASDNLYDVAQKFVLRHDSYHPQKQYLINTMVDHITNHIVEFAPEAALGRKAVPVDPSMDKLSILTPADLAEIEERKKKNEHLRAQVEEEEAKKKKEQEKIKEQILKDRQEVDNRSLSSNFTSYGSNSQYASVVGNDGNVKKVPKAQSKATGIGSLRDLKSTSSKNTSSNGSQKAHNMSGSHHHEDSDVDDDDDDDEDSEEFYPTKEGWNAQLVIDCLKHKGKERTVDIMSQCGFSPFEIETTLKRVINHLSTVPSHTTSSGTATGEHVPFIGQGHKLTTTTTTTETAVQVPQEKYKIEVDPKLPQTRLKVRLMNGAQLTVEVNHTTTVQELILHVGSAYQESNFVLKDMGKRPPELLTTPSLTIKQANLLNGNVVQVKLT